MKWPYKGLYSNPHGVNNKLKGPEPRLRMTIYTGGVGTRENFKQRGSGKLLTKGWVFSTHYLYLRSWYKLVQQKRLSPRVCTICTNCTILKHPTPTVGLLLCMYVVLIYIKLFSYVSIYISI